MNRKVKKILLDVCMDNRGPSPIKNDIESIYDLLKSEHVIIREGMSISLQNNDIDGIRNALDLIFEDDFIKDNFSEAFINDKLLDIISNAFKLPINERSGFIDEQFISLRDYLKNEIKEWTFWIPIDNLKVSNTINIGNIKLFLFDETIAENIKRNINSEDIERFSEFFIYPSINNTFAEVKVKGIQDYAKFLALNKIRLVMNAMKLYGNPKNPQFGPRGEVILPTKKYNYIYRKEGKAPIITLEDSTNVSKYDLDENKLKIMKDNGFEELDKMLRKDKHSDFETRLLNSIYWFGEALNSSLPDGKCLIFKEKKKKHENLEYFKFSERIIKLFTALESVLIFDKKEPIAENISERVAMLMGNEYEDRKEHKKRMKNLYEIRSVIIHDGNAFVSKYDVIELTEYVRAILINLIKLKIEYQLLNRFDLKEYIDKLKFN